MTERDSLERIQREEPLHVRVYAEGVAFCRECPSRKACRAASVALAVVETRVISGGTES